MGSCPDLALQAGPQEEACGSEKKLWKPISQAYNFGVGFQNCIKAILSSAASSIILNGRRTKAVKMTRSVRQGCPLSPLLFILATQTLTEAMENEVESGRIQGIYLQKANLHYCLGLYADDSHVIIRATREGAMNTKRLLDTFGKATGLQIQWNKSAARWISTEEGERPQWAEDLGWCWKDKTETTQLLGFPFEEGINREELYQKCQRRISEASESALVASKVVLQRTKDGGLGLVSLTQQYLAFVARTMRWAFQRGKHPLKSIIQGAVEDENMEAFGVPGVQWMQTHVSSKRLGKSDALKNIFATWTKLKKYVKGRTWHTVQDWEVRPLWGTAEASKDGKVRKAHSRARRLLWEVGYRRLGDLTTTDGKTLAQWEQRKIQGAEQGTVKLAFSKLTANLQGPQEITLKSDEKIRMFYETDEHPGVLWEWSTDSGEKWRNRKPPRSEESGRTYEERNDFIIPCKISIEPNEDSEFKAVAVITFRGGQSKVSRVRYADMAEEARDLATLCWDNGSQFFEASNSQIRHMLTKNQQAIEERIRKWRGVADITTTDASRWKKIWRPGRARRECFLLWSLCLKVVPMNCWRFPSLPNSDAQKWCKRCGWQEPENALHVFWTCTEAQTTWKEIIRFNSGKTNQQLEARV
ncbi:hypothetical protein R1sor_009616 [Riccia sorocarpa]|uniref:Reverse transcriptase domain-containing protein n=1 Tax=Riccia sorocarpa TaxID=122646 RepID=A0ABD3HZL5_9MARC